MNLYESGKAAKIVGVQERTLRYWATMRMIEPAQDAVGRPGIRRLYSFENLVEAAILRELGKVNVNISQSRQVLEIARKRGVHEKPLGEIFFIRIVGGNRVDVVSCEDIRNDIRWGQYNKAPIGLITDKGRNQTGVTDEERKQRAIILDLIFTGLIGKKIDYYESRATLIIIPVHYLRVEIADRTKSTP
jgi:DNA-binding transcriptional MerR regulator